MGWGEVVSSFFLHCTDPQTLKFLVCMFLSSIYPHLFAREARKVAPVVDEVLTWSFSLACNFLIASSDQVQIWLLDGECRSLVFVHCLQQPAVQDPEQQRRFTFCWRDDICRERKSLGRLSPPVIANKVVLDRRVWWRLRTTAITALFSSLWGYSLSRESSDVLQQSIFCS